MARCSSAASSPGSDGRTVKLRSARIPSTVVMARSSAGRRTERAQKAKLARWPPRMPLPSRQFRVGRGINGRWWITSGPPAGVCRSSYDDALGQRREAPDASVDHVIAALDRGEGRDGRPEGDQPLFLPEGTTALPPHLAGRSLLLEDGTDLGPVHELPPDLTPGLHVLADGERRTLLALHPACLLAPRRPAGLGLGPPAPRGPLGAELGPRRPGRRRDHRRLVAGPGRSPAAPAEPAPRPEPRRRGAGEPVLRLEPVLPEPAVPAHRRRPGGRAGPAGRPRWRRTGPQPGPPHRPDGGVGAQAGGARAHLDRGRRRRRTVGRSGARRLRGVHDRARGARRSVDRLASGPAPPGRARVGRPRGRPRPSGRVPPVGPTAGRRAARGGPVDDPAGARPGHRHRPRGLRRLVLAGPVRPRRHQDRRAARTSSTRSARTGACRRWTRGASAPPATSRSSGCCDRPSPTARACGSTT